MLNRLSLTALIILAALSAIAPADAKQRSAKDQALYEKAYKDCNSPKWPNGANIVINYSGGWYRCEGISSKH